MVVPDECVSQDCIHVDTIGRFAEEPQIWRLRPACERELPRSVFWREHHLPHRSAVLEQGILGITILGVAHHTRRAHGSGDSRLSHPS